MKIASEFHPLPVGMIATVAMVAIAAHNNLAGAIDHALYCFLYMINVRFNVR